MISRQKMKADLNLKLAVKQWPLTFHHTSLHGLNVFNGYSFENKKKTPPLNLCHHFCLRIAYPRRIQVGYRGYFLMNIIKLTKVQQTRFIETLLDSHI